MSRLARLIEQARRVEEKVLLSNPWIEVRDVVEPGKPGYTYVYEPRTGGQRVCVLPFRRNPDGSLSYLLRSEPIVAWMEDKSWGGSRIPCALTGGMDKDGEDPVEAAMRELGEETGFVLPDPSRLIPLGSCFVAKCLSTRYHLFAADCTGLLPKLSTTDGTVGESACRVLWSREPWRYDDALLGMAVMRLQGR